MRRPPRSAPRHRSGRAPSLIRAIVPPPGSRLATPAVAGEREARVRALRFDRAVRMVRAMGAGKRKRRPEQLVLARTQGHGGKRKGAGRPPGRRRRVPHRKRAAHVRGDPVHLTLRARRGLPSLRCESVRKMFLQLLAEAPRPDFQITHHSVQRDHIHLIGEAANEAALSSGMRSLAIRFARRLDALLGRRRGKVWDHRYHRHDLRTPTEVKNTLLYVLQNAKKHGEAAASQPLLDPHSSAAWFDGWGDRARDPTEDGSWRPPRPRTWLLDVGWRRRGLLRTTDAPHSSPTPRARSDDGGRRLDALVSARRARACR